MKPIPMLAAALLAAPLLSAQGARLGVSLQPADEGVRVAQVVEDSAASLAGLQAGDVIVSFDGRPVAGMEQLVERVGAHRPGDVAHLKVRRGRDRVQEHLVVLGRGEAAGPPESAFLGVMLRDAEEGPGVEVVEVVGESPAQVLGLRAGDVLLALDGQAVANLEALGAALGGHHAGDLVSLTGRRSGGVIRLHGILGRRPEEGGAMRVPTAEIEEPPAPPAPPEPPKPSQVHEGWHPNLEVALAEARRSGRPVLVDFYADWCGPCQALGREVFHNAEYAPLMGRFERVQVNVDEDPDLAKKFGVRGIPDVRFLDGSGKEMDRFVGFSGAEATVEKLEAVLEKSGGRTARATAPQAEAEAAAAREQAREAEFRARRARLQARIRALQEEIEALRKELEELRRLQP